MAILAHTVDLRLHDNPSLHEALPAETLKPVYVWDDDYLDQYGDHYKAELRDALRRLNHAYKRRGTHLTLLTGDTCRVLASFDETTYLTDHAATTKRRNTLHDLSDEEHVTIIKDQPIQASNTSQSNAAITRYFDQPCTPAPDQLPDNPWPDNAGTKREEPRNTVDLTVFNHHADNYLHAVSKPSKAPSRTTRLSHHLCNGHVSLRDAHRRVSHEHGDHPVLNRLRWNLRFKQKLTNYPEMHEAPINPYFEDHTPYQANEEKLSAWKTGRTGYPLVDASMRCLLNTGYLNFRMRALLATFLTHILRQPWWHGAQHMHKHLIDAEPAINHYQWQMQSNTIGSHPLRVYNPTKQASEHDPHAVFIKEWVSELNNASPQHAITPWDAPPTSPAASYHDRIVTYDEQQTRIRDWFTQHMPNITKHIHAQGSKALLSEASKKRLRKRLDKHSNDDLTTYT